MRTLEEKRKIDRDWKKMKRRTDPEWLEKERERRRKYGKNRVRNKEKEREYSRTYRAKKKNEKKEYARQLVRKAINAGAIIVPKRCELCGKIPKPFNDNRRTLRADHYKGYNKPLEVQFICVDCDGKQLRSKESIIIDK